MLLSDYRRTRVPFGVAALTFAIVRTMKQTARDIDGEFPLAKQHIFILFMTMIA